MQRLISVDWRATFGFLKKPDINEGIYLTYNLLHKPALLGILGAVAGLGGYGRPDYMPAGRVLEYRRRLAGVRVAIAPIEADDPAVQQARRKNPVAASFGSDRGNFRKATIKYTNTVGYANDGSTLIVAEQMLLGPAYRTWLLLDDTDEVQAELLKRLPARHAEYVPYLGKNEFPLWWDNVREWEWELFAGGDSFTMRSIFKHPGKKLLLDTAAGAAAAAFGHAGEGGSFVYFERLPVGFQPMGKEEQYQLEEFVLTDFELLPENELPNVYAIRHDYASAHIQLI